MLEGYKAEIMDKMCIFELVPQQQSTLDAGIHLHHLLMDCTQQFEVFSKWRKSLINSIAFFHTVA